MDEKQEFRPDDLVLFVWPRQSEPLIRAGDLTWRAAAAEAWAMDAEKADRVAMVIAVYEDEIKGAWGVGGVEHDLRIPEGKTRRVNRSSFTLQENDRLEYLRGLPSPLGRRRNPQATIELRDLPGADFLIGDRAPKSLVSVAHLGRATVSVRPDGSIEVLVPAGTSVLVRTIEGND